MMRKIDDFLIDKVFQKIADFSFSYFGLSGVRIAHYLLPVCVLSLCWYVLSGLKNPFLDTVVVGLLLYFGISNYTAEKNTLNNYEKLLMKGARNPKRINSHCFVIRILWFVFMAFDILIVIPIGHYKVSLFILVAILYICQLYLDATDINPPKKKKSFKLALEPQ